MARRAVSFVVDDELIWIVEPPPVPRDAVRPASPGGLAELTAQLDAELQAARQQRFLACALDVFARVMADAAGGLPPLPFIGEPFGGRGGTD